MAGYTTAFKEALQKLVFQGDAIAALSGVTTLYVSLHTADPGVGGAQNTNEVAYTGYARVGVPRSAAGFDVNGPVANFLNSVLFALGTGGSSQATFFGIGTGSSGAGYLIGRAPLNKTLNLGTNQQAQIDDTSAMRLEGN